MFKLRKSRILTVLLILPVIIFAYLMFSSQQPDLTVVGYISEADGLGRQSLELIDAFRKELSVNFVRTRKEKGERLPERFLSILEGKKPRWGKVIIFEDMLWRPNKEYYKKILSSDRNKSIRIAYSLWESTKIPDEWVDILNSHFDAVVVPCPFLVQTYTNSGVKIPIFELPLGLNLDEFLKEPIKQNPGKPFVFGNLSACSERKNQVLLVRAFAKAFGNDPDVLLRINSRYGEKEVSDAIENEISRLQLDNVIFTKSALSKKEYLDLFKSIDCYVSPSKGEGYSIQPREAMALGIPVIVTNNTGQEVICDSGLVKTVSSTTPEPAVFPWGERYGQYFDCDGQELANAMKEVRSSYFTYLQKAHECRKWTEQYCYNNLRAYFYSLIKPGKVFLSEEDITELDRVITSSVKLFCKYKRLLTMEKES